MKAKSLSVVSLSILLASCSPTVKLIGDVNMISNRNVEKSMKYSQITTYSGGSDREIRRSRSMTIQDAVDATVRKIPGGEYIMNAKIYLVNSTYLAVEGDVWGNPTEQSYKGFKIGDNVTWKKGGSFYNGTIIALKDDRYCYIKEDNGTTIEKIYDDITKTQSSPTLQNPTNNSSNQNPQYEQKVIPPQQNGGFKVGDAVKFTDFERITPKEFEGTIVEFIYGRALVEYYNPTSGKTRKRQVDIKALTKVPK